MKKLNFMCRNESQKRIRKIRKLIFLSVLMAFVLIFTSACFNNDKTIFKYEVNTDGKTCTITGFKGNIDIPKDVVVPEKIGKYKVTEIGNYAFYRNYTIESIEMPEGITRIGDYAFSYCWYLKEAKLPDSVTTIGDSAFSNCNSELKSNIPASLKEVGMDSEFFSHATEVKKEEYVYKEGYVYREEYVYYASKGDNPHYALIDLVGYAVGPETVKINSSTVIVPKGIGKPFSGIEFVVEEGNEHFTAIDGALYSKDGKTLISDMSSKSEIKIRDGVEIVAGFSVDPRGRALDVIIPSSVKSISGESLANCMSVIEISVKEKNSNYKTIDGNLYTKDGKTLVAYAKGKEAEHFTVPDGVEKIGDYAFYRCRHLTSITIPDSVTHIGESAFSYCTNLNTVNISDGVTTIGDRAFASCGLLKEISIPNTVKKIGSRAFYDCYSLTSVVIPDSVESMGNAVFQGCNKVKEISIGKNLKDIDPLAFSGTQATNIKVSPKNKNYKSIDGSLYSKDGKILVKYAVAKYETATVPKGVKKIGDNAFDNNSTIVSIVLPEDVNVIGNLAFWGCYSLEKIEIPSSVTTIGRDAFSGCDRLKDIHYNGSQEQWNKIDIVEYNPNDFIWKRVVIHFK